MTLLDFEMTFDIGTIKHLGLQMYSTLPPVIGELVSNAWDADATRVDINIPIGPIAETSEITVVDDGMGMSDQAVRQAYLVVGRDRRKDDGDAPTPRFVRKVMGRKGIGKFSSFGIAEEIEVETVCNGEVSRFKMNYKELERHAAQRKVSMPSLPPTKSVKSGTKITLRKISKYHNRSIPIQTIRRRLARRFSIIGGENHFDIYVNGDIITRSEQDLKLLLDRDADGKSYIWEYDDVEIVPNTGWKVSGWIGTLDRTKELDDAIQRGVVIYARGKLVQDPFVFDATVGQQYALSYIVGELHAEFVDENEDTVSTTRNSLVWDTEANSAFKQWGEREVNKIARQWSDKRSADNERELAQNNLYVRFKQEAQQIDNRRAEKVADKLIREMIKRNPIASVEQQEPVIQMCLDFLEFDAFWDLAQEVAATSEQDTAKIMLLFREWEVVEAKEMMRVTEGRIATIQKLQRLIEENALEVPTLHNFLKEFPWVLDPRWTLIADERTYSQMLRTQFPDDDLPDEDRRIDFLCVREGTNLVVVEIKRPKVRASTKELSQIEEYVSFMRDNIQRTTDPELRHKEVVGYLLCGDLVDTWKVRQKRSNLEEARIFVRRYSDLLQMVKASHAEFLERYEQLRAVKKHTESVPVDS